MKLSKILSEVYCKPWIIMPSMHRQISAIVRDHASGAAHAADGRAALMSIPDEDDEDAKVTMPDGIRCIEINGVISRRVGSMERVSGVTDIMDCERDLDDAIGDGNCRGILMSFDTPGGTVSGVPELGAKIYEYASHGQAGESGKKPILAFVDDLCASAGYWLAAGASQIFAARSAQVGSIGVYQAFLDESRAYELAGLKVDLFKTGDFKGMGIPGLPLTEAQRQHMQEGVNRVFGWFTQAVNDARGKLPDECFGGQVFFSEDAKRLGLIDGIGSMGAAIAELQAMCGGQ